MRQKAPQHLLRHELMIRFPNSVSSSLLFYVQEKKDMRSSVLLGVTLKGVLIYQVGPTHSIYTFIFEGFDLLM